MITRAFNGDSPTLLGYGCMRFPNKDDKILREEAGKLVDRAWEGGIRYYDTAYRYHGGDSELFIGEALKKYPRKEFYLATKLPTWMVETKEDAVRIFEDQLDRCQVEYFDFYLIHALNKDAWEKMEALGIYDLLAGYKAEGKIRHLGFSFHDSPEVLETICSAHPFEFAQIQCNYFDWEYSRAGEQYAVLEKHNMGCIIMEPVRGGMLAGLNPETSGMLEAARPGKSLASWAIRFAASLPNVITVLSGMSTMEQVEDNLDTMNGFEPLSEEEKALVLKVGKLLIEKKMIPCTACRYCVDQCPISLPIPDMIAKLNDALFNHSWKEFGEFVKGLDSKPSGCLDCGACEDICPQHISIREQVIKAAQRAENK